MRDQLAQAVLLEDLARRQRALGLAYEKVDAPEYAVDLVARLSDRLADFRRQHGRKPLDLADQFGAKAADHLDATGQWLGGPAWLRGAGARAGRRNRLGGVVGQFGNDAAVRGVENGQHAEADSRRVARAALRKSLSSASPDRIDAFFQSWNSGCHCTAAR